MVVYEVDEDGSPNWMPYFNATTEEELNLIVNFVKLNGWSFDRINTGKWGDCVEPSLVDSLINLLITSGCDVRPVPTQITEDWYVTAEKLYGVKLISFQ